jgi:predicted CoA-substrate-specific enzyme activase
MPFKIGIDIGSRNTKIVVLKTNSNEIAYKDYCDTGINPPETVRILLDKACSILNTLKPKTSAIAVTGYGRNLYKADKVISEISCHALGVQYYFPDAATIIDIGGQDCKVISIGQDGKVIDFVMNDKCAAGTGRFLEMVAIRLSLPCSELAELASGSGNNYRLSNTCVVFAESEIIGLISKGVLPADIARSVHLSIAERIISQVNQLDWHSPVIFTGGVANNDDLRKILSDRLQCEILAAPDPEITGALGAALLAE